MMTCDDEYGDDEYGGDEYSGDEYGGDALTGVDQDRVVTVRLDGSGVVQSIQLTADWQSTIDVRQLDVRILEALSSAALAAAEEHRPHAEPDGVEPTQDTSPLSLADLRRLRDTAAADIRRFEKTTAERDDAEVSFSSDGGHVTVTADAGTLVAVAVDPAWARGARHTEIQHELTEAFRRFSVAAADAERTGRLRSDALDEIRRLTADPRRLFIRLGLLDNR